MREHRISFVLTDAPSVTDGMRAYMQFCTHICIYAHVYAYMRACRPICWHICISHICTYAHIFVHPSSPLGDRWFRSGFNQVTPPPYPLPGPPIRRLWRYSRANPIKCLAISSKITPLKSSTFCLLKLLMKLQSETYQTTPANTIRQTPHLMSSFNFSTTPPDGHRRASPGIAPVR